MSWRTVNQILGLASIDPKFRQILQDDPLSATEVLGFELTPEEQEVFRTCASLSFAEFCQQLLEQLAPCQQDENGC
jgi:hypothetical protein